MTLGVSAACAALLALLPLSHASAVAGKRQQSTLAVEYSGACALYNSSVTCWGYSDELALGFQSGNYQDDSDSTINAYICEQDPHQLQLSFNSTFGAATGLWGADQRRFCASFDTGRVVCWGPRSGAILGVGATPHPNVNADASAFIAIDFGADAAGVPYTAKTLAAKNNHACIIRNDDKVLCWGENNQGHLGVEYPGVFRVGADDSPTVAELQPVELWDETSPPVQLALTRSGTCILLANGRAACWGFYAASGGSAIGQDLGSLSLKVGTSDKAVKDLSPIVFGNASVLITHIDSGMEHVCALSTEGGVFCWGSNQGGLLGLGHTNTPDVSWPAGAPPVDLGAGRKAVGISLTDSSTCAVLESGDVLCWGGSFARTVHRGAAQRFGAEAASPVSAAPRLPLHPRWNDFTVSHFQIESEWQIACATFGGDNVQCFGTNRECKLGLPGRSNTLSVSFHEGDVDLADIEFTLGGLPSASPSVSPSSTTTPSGTPSVSGTATATASPTASSSPSSTITAPATAPPSTSVTASASAAAGAGGRGADAGTGLRGQGQGGASADESSHEFGAAATSATVLVVALVAAIIIAMVFLARRSRKSQERKVAEQRTQQAK